MTTPNNETPRVHCWLACGCGGVYEVDEGTAAATIRYCHYHRLAQRVVSTMQLPHNAGGFDD